MADEFAESLLAWWDVHGRKDLPWQQPRTPYRVWISEIMLQQTQVAAVIPYFERFVARFPDVESLARGELDDVLHLWSGLGYYARGRNLHRAARLVVAEMDGELPDSEAALQALPGIGRSTAAAIVAQAFDQRAVILDGNVKRVLARQHRVPGPPSAAATARALWALAEAHTPTKRTADYTQAIMDLGATLCRRRPDCAACPVRGTCAAFAAGDAMRFPERRAKSARRLERRRFFVLRAPDGACFVEQRPMDGIWGGLWSPPERPAAETPERFLQEFGIRLDAVAEVRVAPLLHHGFTHYDLDVEPVYVRLNSRPRTRSGCWIDPDDHGLGLSAVAAKLLAATKGVELEP